MRCQEEHAVNPLHSIKKKSVQSSQPSSVIFIFGSVGDPKVSFGCKFYLTHQDRRWTCSYIELFKLAEFPD